MDWEKLLSLKKQGDKNKRLRSNQDITRVGFEVDYDRIVFSTDFIFIRAYSSDHVTTPFVFSLPPS